MVDLVQNSKYHFIPHNFMWYKFFNSLFTGLSIGAIFILYAPLTPITYSIGGIALALMLLIVANFYTKILNIKTFYSLSIFSEVLILLTIFFVLFMPNSFVQALLIYIGYQITFGLGGYFVRAETLILKKKKLLSIVDIKKQQGYLLGMILSYLFYQILEFFEITSKTIQIYWLHPILLITQIIVIGFLFLSFKKSSFQT